MHGAGNDFIVIDLRDHEDLTPDFCQFLSDRHRGIGCDMILGIGSKRSTGSVASFRIWTPEGKSSKQCGNGMRCVAAWLFKNGITSERRFIIDSPSGSHDVEVLKDSRVRVSLAIPEFSPNEIPLRDIINERDFYELHTTGGLLVSLSAVSMGNPHAVIEVQDVDEAPVEYLGREVQRMDQMPPTINVGFAQVLSRDHIRLRVFEFGAGETLACGSGACAAAAVLIRRGQTNRDITVSVPGGDLQIAWPSVHKPIMLTGPAAFVFEGRL